MASMSKFAVIISSLPLPRSALIHVLRDALHPVPVLPPLLGEQFDRELWSLAPTIPGSTPVTAALIELAHKEMRAGRWSAAAAVARLTRERFPHEPEPQRMLTVLAAWLPPHDAPPFWLKDPETYYLALGEAYRLLGEPDQAAANYRAALKAEPDLPDAHIALASLRMPGMMYRDWIGRLYAALMPSTVIEVGVFEGETLARVPPHRHRHRPEAEYQMSLPRRDAHLHRNQRCLLRASGTGAAPRQQAARGGLYRRAASIRAGAQGLHQPRSLLRTEIADPRARHGAAR